MYEYVSNFDLAYRELLNGTKDNPYLFIDLQVNNSFPNEKYAPLIFYLFLRWNIYFNYKKMHCIFIQLVKTHRSVRKNDTNRDVPYLEKNIFNIVVFFSRNHILKKSNTTSF